MKTLTKISKFCETMTPIMNVTATLGSVAWLGWFFHEIKKQENEMKSEEKEED